jgi:hypothetical protein
MYCKQASRPKFGLEKMADARNTFFGVWCGAQNGAAKILFELN